jgi:hypothetical protein
MALAETANDEPAPMVEAQYVGEESAMLAPTYWSLVDAVHEPPLAAVQPLLVSVATRVLILALL